MAVDRMAEDRKRTNQILAVESARLDRSAQTGCHCKTALAHRARLRRTEAGTWPGTLRRPELARVSPSCNVIDCCLRMPGHGAVPFSPLWQLEHGPSSRHPTSNTPRAIRLHAPRRCPYVQNGIIPNRSLRCAGRLQHTSPDLCPDVPVV